MNGGSKRVAATKELWSLYLAYNGKDIKAGRWRTPTGYRLEGACRGAKDAMKNSGFSFDLKPKSDSIVMSSPDGVNGYTPALTQAEHKLNVAVSTLLFLEMVPVETLITVLAEKTPEKLL